ncbi:hypothetical protein KP509_13G063300 [Ceratopteris richardii]|uniref:Uncharacterized protein n=1 Tax=Ceratopteris richardii TaxID=49495 RepID=A0A8T2TGC1_CERRI|nr:hypothetical protein KP509_13G063300 [Ceratopteris richardii]
MRRFTAGRFVRALPITRQSWKATQSMWPLGDHGLRASTRTSTRRNFAASVDGSGFPITDGPSEENSRINTFYAPPEKNPGYEQNGVDRESMPSPVAEKNERRDHNEYNIQKARIHASLWKQEIQKHLGEAISADGDVDLESRVSPSTDVRKSMPDDWESLNPQDGQYYDGGAVMEESMMMEEFEKRRERNRIQIAGFVKQHIYGRRRPVDGWKYILNNFGKDPKGSRGSALGREGQPAGTELEKLAIKKESGNLGRRRSSSIKD